MRLSVDTGGVGSPSASHRSLPGAATLASVLYAALAVVLTWPLAAELDRVVPAGGDNLYVAWSLAWVARAAVYEPERIFEGNIFHPARHALAFSDPNVSSGLLLAPVYFMTKSPALLVNLLFLGSFVLCGLAAFLLAREWGATDRAAVAGGVFFAFSPLRFSHVDHLQLFAFWWTPVALLVFDRYLREGRRAHAWLTALLVVLQVHASVYLAVFQATALVLLLAVSAATGRARVSWTRLMIDLSVAAIGAIVLCVPLGSAYYSVNRTWGVTRSLEQNVRYSASVWAFLSAAPANVFWGRMLEGFADPRAPWEKYLFPGLVPVALAILGLLRERRAFLVRYGLVLLLLGAFLSLGPLWISSGPFGGTRLPYYFAYEWVLPLRALRAPARWALMASLGLALVASAGAARVPRVAWVVAVVLAVAEAWVSPLPLQPVPSIADRSLLDRFLADSGQGPVIELPLGADGDEQFQLEPARVYRAALHWRPLANGYSGFTPATYRELARLSSDGPSPELLRFFAAWDLRTVVLHGDQVSASVRGAWERMRTGNGVREVFREGDTSVFQLSLPAESIARTRAELKEGAHVVAGRRQPLEVRLVTGDHAVALPPGVIGWHSGRAGWSFASGSSSSGWVRYYCPPAIDSRRADGLLFVEAPSQQGAYLLEVAGACFDLSASVTVQPATENR